jgi:hypothetical protein
VVTHGSTLRSTSGIAPAVHTVNHGMFLACHVFQPRCHGRVEAKCRVRPR